MHSHELTVFDELKIGIAQAVERKVIVRADVVEHDVDPPPSNLESEGLSQSAVGLHVGDVNAAIFGKELQNVTSKLARPADEMGAYPESRQRDCGICRTAARQHVLDEAGKVAATADVLRLERAAKRAQIVDLHEVIQVEAWCAHDVQLPRLSRIERC